MVKEIQKRALRLLFVLNQEEIVHYPTQSSFEISYIIAIQNRDLWKIQSWKLLIEVEGEF